MSKLLTKNGKIITKDGEGFIAPIVSTQSKTVIPTASGITVTPDEGKLLSSVIVNGDADLVPSNIRNGVNIFGINGSLKFEDLKVWEATVSSDKTSSFDMLTDSWLTEHYADANLIVAVFPEFTLPTSACWAYSIAANF